jgi:hypothetical protein
MRDGHDGRVRVGRSDLYVSALFIFIFYRNFVGKLC